LLSRLALAALLRGREMRGTGGFTWLRDMVPSGELQAIFSVRIATSEPAPEADSRDR
jgi:hypothetical protein